MGARLGIILRGRPTDEDGNLVAYERLTVSPTRDHVEGFAFWLAAATLVTSVAIVGAKELTSADSTEHGRGSVSSHVGVLALSGMMIDDSSVELPNLGVNPTHRVDVA